jgi:hypothetical protein
LHQVGFRGVEGNATPAAGATSGDATLDLAIEVAENQPVAQL